MKYYKLFLFLFIVLLIVGLSFIVSANDKDLVKEGKFKDKIVADSLKDLKKVKDKSRIRIDAYDYNGGIYFINFTDDDIPMLLITAQNFD